MPMRCEAVIMIDPKLKRERSIHDTLVSCLDARFVETSVSCSRAVTNYVTFDLPTDQISVPLLNRALELLFPKKRAHSKPYVYEMYYIATLREHPQHERGMCPPYQLERPPLYENPRWFYDRTMPAETGWVPFFDGQTPSTTTPALGDTWGMATAYISGDETFVVS